MAHTKYNVSNSSAAKEFYLMDSKGFTSQFHQHLGNAFGDWPKPGSKASG
jgi:hypothetical protein